MPARGASPRSHRWQVAMKVRPIAWTRPSEPRVPTYDYDIAMLSDFRYPGGTSVSLAEEIKAQVSAGYNTVLVPAKAPHLARRRPFNPRLVEIIQGGLATLAPPDAELRVRLLIANKP